MNNIAFHGAHDGNVSFIDRNDNIRIYELERYCKIKNAALSIDHIANWGGPDLRTYENFLKLIKMDIHSSNIDTCLYNQLSHQDLTIIAKLFNVKNYVKTDHHLGHARCSVHQSPYDAAIVYSFDGGGHDINNVLTFFNIYLWKNKNLTHLHTYNINFGSAYSLLGDYIKIIKPTTNINNNAGKIMALASYGKVIQKWIPDIEYYYKTTDVNCLIKSIKLDLTNFEDTVNLCATSQHVFESLFDKIFTETYKPFNGYPVCLSGGCALNITNNQLIKNKLGDSNVFVPPNPNDAGLSFGYLLDNTPKLQKININTAYSGIDLQNKTTLSNIKSTSIDYDVLCKQLKDNKILAVANGYSECGPRALGNRSILCYPTQRYLIEHINKNIKFREWFRPFAPVVLDSDKDIFFKDAPSSRYMSFSTNIKNEYVNEIPAIIHVDYTSRLQTVSKHDNAFLYTLLNEMKLRNMYPVLLNTSFNIKGRPIINDINDIINIKKEVPIDIVIINNKIYE